MKSRSSSYRSGVMVKVRLPLFFYLEADPYGVFFRLSVVFTTHETGNEVSLCFIAALTRQVINMVHFFFADLHGGDTVCVLLCGYIGGRSPEEHE